MENFAKTLAKLSPIKRVMIISSLLLTVFGMYFVTQVAQRPNMVLLYAGLNGKAAGEVIEQLEQRGIASEVRGASIYVPEKDRDRVRMNLAASGLPANGQDGYELLDGLSGFGTTAEMFDAAYWRAKEGELARTLLSTPGIRQARVHIGAPRRRNFARTRAVPTASVTLTGSSGAVSRQNATAARYLVALAIPGLAAEQVAVIDSAYGVVLRPGDSGVNSMAGDDGEQAAKMTAQVEALLAARVGDGRARVTVNIERTRETESISRRVIDPESRALRESKTIEMAEKGNDSGGNVTVASNLPDGDANAESQRSSERDENRKTDRYDYTETREEILRPAGTLKRISVAVLLDEIRTTAEDGTQSSEPRTKAELAKLENLVKSAVGFDEERGDVVTVESISFAEIPQQGSTAVELPTTSFVEANMMELIQIGVLALVALILGLFVVRPVLAASQASDDLLEDRDPALSAIDVTPPAATAEPSIATGLPSGAPAASPPPTPPTALELLRETVGSRTEESAGVLKQWLENEPQGGTVQ